MSALRAQVRRTWFHWILIGLCSLWMLIQGLMDVAWGAGTNSRFYAVDDVFVRCLGVALVVTALLLPLRRASVYRAGVALLVVGAIEILATSRFEDFSRDDTGFILALVLVLFALPAAALAYLSRNLRPTPALVASAEQGHQPDGQKVD